MTRRIGPKSGSGHSDEKEYECLDCHEAFWTLRDSEAHQCPTPLTTPDGLTIASAINLDPSGPPALTPPSSPTATPLNVYLSTVYPGLGPLTNVGDSSRVWPVETEFLDTQDIRQFMVSPDNFGQREVITTAKSYAFVESRYPGPLENAAVTWYRCSAQGQLLDPHELLTWCVSQTLVGPVIVLHRLFHLLVSNNLRWRTPNSLLTFGTCLEDLESYMSLSLSLSRTRAQEAEYLTRIISVSLPPSIELGSCMASLSAREDVRGIGMAVQRI